MKHRHKSIKTLAGFRMDGCGSIQISFFFGRISVRSASYAVDLSGGRKQRSSVCRDHLLNGYYEISIRGL